MNDALLEVNSLCKSFDRLEVLKGLTFAVKAGEEIGLVGRQGSGHSTVVNLLSGTMTPSGGTIVFDGKQRRFSNRNQSRKLGIEVVHQSAGPVNRFDAPANLLWNRVLGVETARSTSGLLDRSDFTHNLFLGMEKQQSLGILDWEQMIQEAQNLIAEFELPPSITNVQVRNLSDENRQILLLLRAMYHPSRLLLLDDILPALSFERQSILIRKLKSIATQGTAVIIISDDLKTLFNLTDRIMVLYEGCLVADRKTADAVPREIVELIVGSSRQEEVSPMIWALESYHAAQKQTEELRKAQTSLKESLQAQDSLNRELIERQQNQLFALDKLNAALQATQRRLISEREGERKSLARELHDQIIQDLLGINYRLEEIEEGEKNPGIRKEVSSIRKGIRNAVSELRQVCSNLRPPAIDHHGLSGAIDSLAQEWADQHAIDLQLEIDPALGRLPEMIELSVFRIIQEGLRNVRKHAEASHVKLSLQRTPSASLLVQLEDDGKGLMAPADLGALSLGKHYGLVGISERVALLGGHMTIESPREGGTILLVEIPSPSPVAT